MSSRIYFGILPPESRCFKLVSPCGKPDIFHKIKDFGKRTVGWAYLPNRKTSPLAPLLIQKRGLICHAELVSASKLVKYWQDFPHGKILNSLKITFFEKRIFYAFRMTANMMFASLLFPQTEISPFVDVQKILKLF